jgi:hypothetical protein
MLANNFQSSFMSGPRDTETILRKLFVESRPYSDKLKRLLILNVPDCLDTTKEQYQDKIDRYSIKSLLDEQYVKLVPKIEVSGHDEVKSYVVMEFDDFVPSENPVYRNGVLTFSIVCNLDQWQLDNYAQRPWMIAGYIDGILNDSKLSGIGRLQFVGASQVVLDEEHGGVILRYISTHSDADDSEKLDEDTPSTQQHGNAVIGNGE